MKKSLLCLLVALAAFAFGVLTANLFVPKQDFVIFKESEKIESAVFGGQKIPFFEISQLSQPEEIEETEPIDNSSDIDAWYSLDNEETYKKMPEVAMIKFNLTYYDDNGITSKEPILYTGIYTTLTEDIDESFAKGIQTKLVKNKLKFKTKKLKGIKYRFQGTFFKNKMTGEQDEEVLRGTLQKYVKGKKVAEVSGNFTYGEPHCLH
jgi:hypothetical protein